MTRETSAQPRKSTLGNVRPIPGALEWVTEHCEEYWGKWVAVGPNGLVAVGDTFPELKAHLRGCFDGVMISHVV
jgi:hypothetical protein